MNPSAVLGYMKYQIEGDIDSRIAAHQTAIAARLLGTPALNLLANGDSWFDYPLDGDLPGIHTDVISSIPGQCRIPPTILNLAHYGDTSIQEMGYVRQCRIEKALRDPANGKFDAILLSAGGNDIAGDALAIWLNDSTSVSGDVAEAVDWDRFNGCMDAVRAAYRGMIDLRDRLLPGAPIFVHSYDYPAVTGIGVCGLGPWLKPSLDLRGWNDPIAGAGIIRSMLHEFDAMLGELAADPRNKVVHVKTQGTIAVQMWANELHPTPAGFKLIAAKFASALSMTFPGRA